MTQEEFAQMFGLGMKAAGQYLKENTKNSKVIIRDGYRHFQFDDDEIQKAADKRYRNSLPFDPETEHDRLTIQKILKVRGISQKDEYAFMKHPSLPEPKRIRPPNHKVYDKQEVDAFITEYFGKTGGVITRKREIKGDAATWIFANRGQFWRIGDTITTRLMHGKEI
jgi:predicted DNA-binding transcriptional regulator AlpA